MSAFEQRLLDHAFALTRPSRRGAPRQVELRRAVSAAYYALFHLLSGEAGRQFAGNGSKHALAAAVLARSLDHGPMKTAAKRIAAGPITPRAGSRLPAGIGGARFPKEILALANTFVKAQDHRHRADYALDARFTRTDVVQLLNEICDAMQSWVRIRREPSARLFLALLLTLGRAKSE